MAAIDLFRTARSEQLRPVRRVVVLIWTVLTLKLWWVLAQRLQFHEQSTTGIISWVTLNHYPKQQDTFYFLLMVVGTPLLVLIGGEMTMLAVARMEGKFKKKPLVPTAPIKAEGGQVNA